MKEEQRRERGTPDDRGWLAKNQKAIIAILLAVIPYAGYNGYKDVKQAIKPAETGTVTVNVQSVPEAMTAHSHVPVVGRAEIKSLIREEVQDLKEHIEQNYKQKESWE